MTRSLTRYADATLNSYERVLRLHLLDHVDAHHRCVVGDLPVDTVDGRVMQRVVESLASSSPTVARVAASALSVVLRHAYERGYVDSLPPRITRPPPPEPRSTVISIAEADELLELAAADDDARGRSLMAPLIALILGTGCRIAEALGLTWGQDGVELDHHTPFARITRESTKSRAGVRELPLDTRTVAALRKHRQATGTPANGSLVFARGDGESLDRGGRIRTAFTRLAMASGHTNLSPLDLRRTRATWLASAGVHSSSAALLLGHADGGALFSRVYAHPGRDDAITATAAVEALLVSASSNDSANDETAKAR